jgi:hypothetical protein
MVLGVDVKFTIDSEAFKNSGEIKINYSEERFTEREATPCKSPVAF